MASPELKRPIRIAISGGGVAGASIMHALLEYPHLDPHIFESAPHFREAGVAFGLTRNATAALHLMGPSATECLKHAGGVAMQGVRFHVAQGKDAGKVVYEADNKEQGKPTTTIVSRQDILRELLSSTPPNRMHASKKLQAVDKKDDGSLVLTFADGCTHECDILLGTDGIHSFVRKVVLGDDYENAAPRNTGWWAVMTLQPYDKARASIGEAPVDIDDAREHSWIGDGTFILHNVVSKGTLVQFCVCSNDSEFEDTDKWTRVVTAGEFRKRFIGRGGPQHLDKAVEQLLCDEPTRTAYYLWDHRPAATSISSNNNICIMGDAAHATTPWQASGGGMCIEDSMLLSSLLGRTKTPAEAQVALQVYNKVRLPRTQDIVKSSAVTGLLVTGNGEGVGLNAERLRTALKPRWDFIVDFDIRKHRDEAIRMFDEELASRE